MRLKTLLLALCVAGTSTFAQKVKYSKEEIKKMETYLFNEGFNTPSPKKTSTIILKDGNTYKGFCNKIETKKDKSMKWLLKIVLLKRTVLLMPIRSVKCMYIQAMQKKLPKWPNTWEISETSEQRN